MKLTLFAYIVLAICPFFIGNAAGHGLGGDVAPPINFDGENITISANMTPSDITVGTIDDANISIRFFNLDTDQNLEKVTYRVEVWRSDQLLARNLYYDVDGNLDINIRPTYNCDEIKLSKCTKYYGAEHPVSVGALYARIGEQLVIKGPLFDKGGLYNIRVDIEGATSPKTLIANDISYDTFISIAQEQLFSIQTASAEVDVVIKTYYDEIENFEYNESDDAISFNMPFNWSPEYISQVALVHEEIQIPNTFTPFGNEKQFKGYIDGVEVDQRVLVLDPYTFKEENINVIHFLVTNNELKRINELLGPEHEERDEMNFKLVPSSEISKNIVDFYLMNENTKENNGAAVEISWDSSYGSRDEIPFQITFFDAKDEIIRNVRYAYILSEHKSNQIITQDVGNDPQNLGILAFEGIDTQVLRIPDDKIYRLDVAIIGQGTMGLDFDPKYAGIGSAFIEVGASPMTEIKTDFEDKQTDIMIPEWVKSNARWWSTGEIDDGTFVGALQYLVKMEIILIPATPQSESTDNVIPEWVKSNAGWWSTGEIDDGTFVGALQYLIENGNLVVSQ
ncbi:MAG: hypothetical protein K8823_193 [Cenarchaeum symbiont of Oopsacas minuta]|nr:hypothetical protein [Cenarchaeum symbiont of Oopsacas minuta]